MTVLTEDWNGGAGPVVMGAGGEMAGSGSTVVADVVGDVVEAIESGVDVSVTGDVPWERATVLELVRMVGASMPAIGLSGSAPTTHMITENVARAVTPASPVRNWRLRSTVPVCHSGPPKHQEWSQRS